MVNEVVHQAFVNHSKIMSNDVHNQVVALHEGDFSYKVPTYQHHPLIDHTASLGVATTTANIASAHAFANQLATQPIGQPELIPMPITQGGFTPSQYKLPQIQTPIHGVAIFTPMSPLATTSAHGGAKYVNRYNPATGWGMPPEYSNPNPKPIHASTDPNSNPCLLQYSHLCRR